MKLISCPLNGPRDAAEFICGGPVKPMPDPASVDDAAWADHVFFEANRAGVVREWWCHVPTAYWFIVERDSVTDTIVTTYPAAELDGRS